ncbi:MAG: SCO2322 family protein [Cumulibacter sp.]
MRSLRALLTTAFAVLIGATGSLILAVSPAHADDIYRYWAYFTVQDGTFVPADTGPADATPADGSIEGYRYAAPADFTNPNLPRADLSTVTFDEVCAGVDAVDGQKRVAVLVDFGVQQDAPGDAAPPTPQAYCAQVPEDANGLQVLESAASAVRTEPGGIAPLLCGINDYPTTGCADEIAESGTPADDTVEFAIAGSDDEDSVASESASDDGTNTALLVGAVVVVLAVAGGGFYLSRRRAA